MPKEVFREMKAYVGFDELDAANLYELRPSLEAGFPAVVDRFYEVLLKHPEAAEVFSGPAQVERLRKELGKWLTTLFGGSYGDDYAVLRSEIGRVHVRVGLSQHYMFAALEVIRQELQLRIMRCGIKDPEKKLESLHKLLALEIGVMLETYKESYTEQVREIERVALRERLARAEHLAQIGQLATSLAHEIKNPLAGISGAIQVIRDRTPTDDNRQPVFEEILRQIDRLDRAVKDLLVYARPQPLRFRHCDLGGVIQRAVDLLRKEPQLQRVRLEHIANPLPSIEIDEDQIEQVLMNIILNAVQASSDEGIVSITARNAKDVIEIQIEDKGQGMSESVRERAFEPFFTTKVRGTGLGLAICRQIVSGHSGTIGIDSTPGEGTVVSVELPFTRKKTETGD